MARARGDPFQPAQRFSRLVLCNLTGVADPFLLYFFLTLLACTACRSPFEEVHSTQNDRACSGGSDASGDQNEAAT